MTSQLDQWKQLSGSVDAGELWLEPGVAKQCADRCERHIEELTHLLDQADHLGHTDGYGDLASAVQLGAKFKQFAVGGGPYYDLKQFLGDRIAVAQQMRDTFLGIHRRYEQAESVNADGVRTVGDDL